MRGMGIECRSFPAASGTAQHSSKRGASARPWDGYQRGIAGVSGWLAAALLATAWLWVGCTTAQVREVRKSPTGLGSNDAVAITFWHEFSLQAPVGIQDTIFGCITEPIRKIHPTLRIVPPLEFRRTAFPDLAQEAAPSSPQSLALLLSHPAFQERLAPLGIRYLISVGGATDQGTWEGGGSGVGLPGSFFGFWSVDRQSRLKATVFDLKQAATSGELHAEASGRPWFAIVGLVPIGAPAFTEGRACRDLGEAIAQFLAGEKPPNP